MTTATEKVYETIEVETADHVRIITLNRPDTYNAFNDQLTTELADALKQAQRDTDVHVLVITGQGKAFSSGQDLGDLKSKYVPGHVPHLGDDLRKRYNPIIRRIREMEKPVIAAVNGVAAGAGCSLALACDLRVASEKASFIEVFINVGLIPDSGSTFTLPRLVGLGKALELCWTSKKVDGQEAAEIGLVNQVVPPEQLMEQTMTLARQLASMPSRAVALTKRLMNETFDNDLQQQLEAECFAQETAGLTQDHVEGVVAFIEKRKPTFKGR
jgi:2-(1,2-epoxy-1,2-dihydrophenyl)acetyl-CoA isomerase